VSSRSLVVLPDDSFKPVLRAIGTASKSLRAKMFVLSDPTVVQALVAARRRGVKVQVILNRAPHGSNEKNEFARAELLRAGVEVAHGNPGFSVTHEKSMVVDDAIAFVKSFNWATKNFRATRDYAVITSHKREVREIADCFDADWHRQRFRPGEPSGLIWCPGVETGPDVVKRLQDVAHHDWKRSRPIDLSDEWILAALEDRDQAGKEPAAGDAVADARPRKLG